MTSDSLRSPPAEETEKNAVPPIIKAIHYTALGVLIFSIFLGIYAAKSSGRGDASAEVFFTIFSLYIPTYVLYAEFKGRIFFPMGPQLFTNKSDGIIYFRIEQAAYMVFPLALILKQILN